MRLLSFACLWLIGVVPAVVAWAIVSHSLIQDDTARSVAGYCFGAFVGFVASMLILIAGRK